MYISIYLSHGRGEATRGGPVLSQSFMKSVKRSFYYDSLLEGLLPLTQKRQACLIPRDFVRKHLSNDDLSYLLQMQDVVPINFARLAMQRNLQHASLAARTMAIDASEDAISIIFRNYNAKETQEPVCSDPSHKTNLDLLCELAADRKPSQ